MVHSIAFEYHYCSTFYCKPKYDKPVENGAGIPGIVHRLENKNLVTFEF